MPSYQMLVFIHCFRMAVNILDSNIKSGRPTDRRDLHTFRAGGRVRRQDLGIHSNRSVHQKGSVDDEIGGRHLKIHHIFYRLVLYHTHPHSFDGAKYSSFFLRHFARSRAELWPTPDGVGESADISLLATEVQFFHMERLFFHGSSKLRA